MVNLIYGDQWRPVVPMLIWLSIASITQPLYNTTGWLFTAAGKAKSYLWLTVISGFVLCISFYLALPYGALGIAKVYGVVMGIIIFFPALWLAHKVAGLSFTHSLRELLPISICLGVMVFAVLMTESFLKPLDIQWQFLLTIKIISGVISYGVLAYITMRNILLKEFFGIFKRI